MYADLVCTTLHTEDKLPLLGYCPPAKEASAALTAAYSAGYRHIFINSDTTNDRKIGRTIKQLCDDGKVTRDDLYIAVKTDVTDAVETLIPRRIRALTCGHFDCLVVTYAPGTDDLKSSWERVERLVKAGHVRCLGISGVLPTTLDALIPGVNLVPAIYLLTLEANDWVRQLAAAQSCHHHNIKIMVSINDHLPRSLQKCSQIASRCDKSLEQVFIRYLLQRGTCVVTSSQEPLSIQQSFQVFDFKLDTSDVVAMTKMLQ